MLALQLVGSTNTILASDLPGNGEGIISFFCWWYATIYNFDWDLLLRADVS
jgi:hypothetical protein